MLSMINPRPFGRVLADTLPILGLLGIWCAWASIFATISRVDPIRSYTMILRSGNDAIVLGNTEAEKLTRRRWAGTGPGESTL